jgi:hypothetical protein
MLDFTLKDIAQKQKVSRSSVAQQCAVAGIFFLSAWSCFHLRASPHNFPSMWSDFPRHTPLVHVHQKFGEQRLPFSNLNEGYTTWVS